MAKRYQSHTRQAATWLNVLLGLLLIMFGGYFILHTVVKRSSMTSKKAWSLAVATSFIESIFKLLAERLTTWE